MECNKDEAIRAKEIAEKKLTEKDISGAKKFASKAQSLFPGLEGLSQFQEVIHVYIASVKKVNGEVDWYEVVGVDPLADDETIRKKYRKLALALHPDKNKSVGADGAFKILSEAWSLLSDKVKRALYNQKRDIKARSKVTYSNTAVGVDKDNKNTYTNTSVGVDKNSRYTYTNASSAAKKSSAAANSQADSTPSRSNANTFWTRCYRCMMQYQYVAIYLNQNLLCPNCRQPFVAKEIPPPNMKAESRKQQSGHPATDKSSHSGRQTAQTQKMGTPGFSGGDSFRENVSKDSSFKFDGSRSMPTATKTAAHSFQSTVGNVSQDSSFKFDGSRSMPTAAKSAAQLGHCFQSTFANLKRGYEEAFSGAVNVEGLEKKKNVSKGNDVLPTYNGHVFDKGEPELKSHLDEHKASMGRKDLFNQMAPGGAGTASSYDSGNQMGRLETEKLITSGINKSRSVNELSHSETCNLLLDKAKIGIREKLKEWNMAFSALLSSSANVGKDMDKDKPNSASASDKSVLPAMTKARNTSSSIEGSHISIHPKKSSLSSVTTCSEKTATEDIPKESSRSSSLIGSATRDNEIMTMSVPDPEFYDFDKDRIEEVFSENQVWAAYDDEDGMPRFYAIIHEVISRKPFKVHISWLNSKSNSELGPLNWVGWGFAKTCGDFRIGKHDDSKTLNSFSQRVKWTRGPGWVIHIFPKKGDVWALYRNWSSDWNELTPDDVIQQYDVVEVVQDYNEEQGVAVAPLVKVAGFRSIFHQHLDSSKMYTIPREEMFRFSHQVPSYLLTGQEAESAPKGCRELDTAAMPLELLQVVKEAVDTEGVRTVDEVSGVGDVDTTSISGDAKDVAAE